MNMIANVRENKNRESTWPMSHTMGTARIVESTQDFILKIIKSDASICTFRTE